MRSSFLEKPSEDKTFPLDNGNFVHFQKDMKFGFWRIQYEHGGTPGILQGRYLTYTDARAAFDKYSKTLVRRPKKIIEDGSVGRRYSPKVNEVRKEMGLEEK